MSKGVNMKLDKNLFEEFDDNYIAELDDMVIELDELNDNFINYANDLYINYNKRLDDLASILLELDEYGYFKEFGVTDVEELKGKLGVPMIRIMNSPVGLCGVLSWMEHKFDEHIIEVEFDGMFENIEYLIIDG